MVVRLVSAWAIDLKHATYMPLGKVTLQTEFRTDKISDSATRGCYVEILKS